MGEAGGNSARFYREHAQKSVAHERYFYALVRQAEKDFGDREYGEYERRLLKRVDALDRRVKKSGEDFHKIMNVFEDLPRERPYEQKLRDFAANLRHLGKWTASGKEQCEGFDIYPSRFEHPESPFSLTASEYTRGKTAAVGFRLLTNPRGITLSINNIQGVQGNDTELRDLSKRLGESWRLALARRVIAYARRNGFAVQAEDFSPGIALSASKGELKRISRQYVQTYRKLGFKKEGGVWKPG